LRASVRDDKKKGRQHQRAPDNDTVHEIFTVRKR
jgi:hypothetical protein